MKAKAKKSYTQQEPILSVVARKLGHAAGTLSKVTHTFLGEGSSEIPARASAKSLKAAVSGEHGGRTPGNKRQSKKKVQRPDRSPERKKAQKADKVATGRTAREKASSTRRKSAKQ
jgi:hypothetical protein